jgi:hypothetical protein
MTSPLLARKIYELALQSVDKKKTQEELTKWSMLAAIAIGKGRLLSHDEEKYYAKTLSGIHYLGVFLASCERDPDFIAHVNQMIDDWPSDGVRLAELAATKMGLDKGKSLSEKVAEQPNGQLGAEMLAKVFGLEPNVENIRILLDTLEHPHDRPIPPIVTETSEDKTTS